MSDKKRKTKTDLNNAAKKAREQVPKKPTDLERFSAIMKAPLFVKPETVRVPLGATITFNCDACNATRIDPVIRSYDDPDHDLCLACYTKLRREATDPDVLKKAENQWAITIGLMAADAALNAGLNANATLCLTLH